jgi:hypothetical protein
VAASNSITEARTVIFSCNFACICSGVSGSELTLTEIEPSEPTTDGGNDDGPPDAAAPDASNAGEFPASPKGDKRGFEARESRSGFELERSRLLPDFFFDFDFSFSACFSTFRCFSSSLARFADTDASNLAFLAACLRSSRL